MLSLFYPSFNNDEKTINIGSAGGMTRLSTGYTFLNIQEHSKYIVKNIDKIEKLREYNLGKKYHFLDKIFLRVLKNHPDKMPKIFFEMFKTSSNSVIKFLSNKSNIFEDIKIISKNAKINFYESFILLMEKINFKHSLIFFNFCIFISPFYLLLNFEPIIFCLVLILILGISHGALDNVKGKNFCDYLVTNLFFFLSYLHNNFSIDNFFLVIIS